MKRSLLLSWLCCLLVTGSLNAQFLLLDDMEGHGPASGRWTYYAGTGATGNVLFNVPNPNPSGLNTSSHVAKFTKDTTCFEWMSAGVNMFDSFDLRSNSVFKMLVYASTKDEIMFKLQPGSDYNKAVYFTYKVSQINQWEEATFDFQSVKNRTDFNRVEVHFIDGKKANGILYFDLVQAPNPTSITLQNTNIAMGAENGAVIVAKLKGDSFKSTLNPAHWTSSNLPPGVTIGSVTKINDSTAQVMLSGNSPANYSRTVLKLTADSTELVHPNAPNYVCKGTVVFDGNPNWTMIFQDDFSGSGFPDKSKWTVDPKPKGWINGEQQVYTDTTHDNVRLENGTLIIKGKKDFPNGNTTEPWSSGRVITQNKVDFTYGKVEVRAKLPRARGSWPAIWLMPTTSAYGAWPRSGEIDIMEHVGNNFGTVLSTVHTQNNNWTNGGHLSNNKQIPDADTVFHVYALEWTPDSLRFMYDSVHCYTYVNPRTDWKDWPFDQKFHIILNVAIGGGMGGSITEADWPDSMTVDYVRVYQKGLGTPILDSISVAPKNISLLPGKTQQFTATAFDQNERTMTVSPVWTITGAGNTITAGGLATVQTSGVVTATATVDSVTQSGSSTVTVRPTNYKTIPVKIEAEAFDNSNVCCTESTSDTGGGLNVSYIGANTWFEYDLNVPDSGAYRIKFRVAVNNAASVRVQLDNDTLTTLKLPVSGGWQNWITVSSAPVVFGPGNKTIRIVANTSGFNFNWIDIVRADSVKIQRLDIAPDSSVIILGDSIQYAVTAFDQQNNYMHTPSLNWFMNASGNTISPSGLFKSAATGDFQITAAVSNSIFTRAFVRVKPVPVLTRIELAPDTAFIPVGASHQFIATGYDQNDSTIAFTSTWSTSGSGNTVSNTGVFTAGNSVGSVTVSVSSGSIAASAVVNTGYGCSVNNKYEAESTSSYSSGPYLQACTDVGGGQNFAGLATGHWFAYNTLNVPAPGQYKVSLRVLSTAAARVKIGHSGLNFGEIDIPSTGGQWKTITDTITLPALTYTGIHVLSGSFRFNWFSIDNCATPPPVLTRIEVSPGTATVAPGETQQFSVKGFNQFNEEMSLPATSWAIAGTGNTINGSGVATAGTTGGIYNVTASVDTFQATSQLTVLSCTVNDKYEAESASARHPGPYLQACTDIGGGQNFAGLFTGHWFAYNTLNVPAAGVYTISLRVSSTAPAQVRVGHSTFTFGTIDIPSTGGAWQTIRDTMTLPALSYTGIHVLSGSFKFNWFRIDDCTLPAASAPSSAGFTTSIQQQDAATAFEVFPNPATDKVMIRLPDAGYQSVTIADLSGRIVRNTVINTNVKTMEYDLSGLDKGIYILSANGTDRKRLSSKIVIQ